MSRAIGVAGYEWTWGGSSNGNKRGRVAAFTKAITLSDFTNSGQNQDLFIRLFQNTVNWCADRRYTSSVLLHDTGNESFNAKITEVLEEIGLFVVLTNPWYEPLEHMRSWQSWSRSAALRIILPTYNANLGQKMPDNAQNTILDEIKTYSQGLLVCEWFHLLQSMNTRKSFSLSTNDSLGLHTVSPFVLDPNKNVVITTVDEMLYIKVKDDDSMSYVLPERFSLTNPSAISDVDFESHLSQLADLREGAENFWITDVPATLQITTTTTTTTTTEAPEEADIKMKVFNVNMIDYCGPQNWYLDGIDKDKFSFDGEHIYLTKKPVKEDDYYIDLVAEDYFRTKRFPNRVEPIEVVIRDCSACITQPKDLSGPVFSWRGYPSPQSHQIAWGSNAPTGVIQNFDDYVITGRGASDDPVLAVLGGKHGDCNAMWLQVNCGGTITGRFRSSTEYPMYASWNGQVQEHTGDIGVLYLVTDVPEGTDPTATTVSQKPLQHNNDLRSLWSNAANVQVKKLAWGDQQDTADRSFSFNVEDPNALDDDGNRIRGDSYIVLYFRKNTHTSKYDDRLYLSAYFGSTTTTPAPIFQFNVLISKDKDDNFVSGTSLNKNVITFNNKATQSSVNPNQTFVISVDPNIGSGIKDLSITDNHSEIRTSFNSFSEPVNSRTVTVFLDSMPVNGGQANILCSGELVGTTSTTTPAPENLVINVVNNCSRTNIGASNGTSFGQTYTRTISDQPGDTGRVNIGVWADSGYEWRDFNKPDMIFVSASPSSAHSGHGESKSPDPGNSSYATIYVDYQMPEGGGTINMKLGEPYAPVATTTSTTSTTGAPCNNLIQIICEQTLVCSEDAEGNCTPALPVSQLVRYETCCNKTESEVLTIIRAAKSAASTATLAQMYASSCPASTSTLLNPCQPKDQNGDCQETIHAVVIDEISCGSSQNPLP
jgi:hypothetical protein